MLTASHQCSATSSCFFLRNRPRSRDYGRSDPASRDSPGRIVPTDSVACSRVSHMFILVLLGDTFSGVVLCMKPFLDIRATKW